MSMNRYTVTIQSTGETFPCDEGTSLLAAMERGRCRGIPVGCRNGCCGACKVQVTKGDFHAAKMSRAVVSAQDERNGCVLACKTFPRTDLSVHALGRVWQHARPNHASPFSFGFAEATTTIRSPDKET